jgi:ADP-L-glycero-D-manno-heptose 6-epimerase
LIVVTGGAGFIGSVLLWRLNQLGRKDLVVVDALRSGDKWQNLVKRHIWGVIHKDQFLSWLEKAPEAKKIEAIVHLGACSSTTERDVDYLNTNNTQYTMALFTYCRERGVPLIYASSAATYGNGEHGYSDDPARTPLLRPINPYGWSKQLFDTWALHQKEAPPFWCGLKFFNVYGPNEYHKGGMQSLVAKAVPQIQEKGVLRLFKSYRDGIDHGEQQRDFIYVKDVVEVLVHVLENKDRAKSGVYNLGTGQARSFADLARAVFHAMNQEARFEWIDMPEDIRNQYQYFTQAEMGRFRADLGYKTPFTSLEEGVREYVLEQLLATDRYL